MAVLHQLSEVPGLTHVQPEAILMTAGSARRASAASIRPFGGNRKPTVTRGGRPLKYEITLRPRFFLRTDPIGRLGILAHELWHISPHFDGTLAEDRRHRRVDPQQARGFVARVLEQFGSVPNVLGIEGEAWMPMWLDRPPSLLPDGHQRRSYSVEVDVFDALVQMKAVSSGRSEDGAEASL